MLGLAAFVASLVQIALMVVRGGMLVILAGHPPAVGRRRRAPSGASTWFKKCIAWLVAFILYKPAAAIVYATAFRLAGSDVFGGDGDELMCAVTGLVLMVLALVALPALMRFVTPMVGAMASGGGGGGGTMAAGARWRRCRRARCASPRGCVQRRRAPRPRRCRRRRTRRAMPGGAGPAGRNGGSPSGGASSNGGGGAKPAGRTRSRQASGAAAERGCRGRPGAARRRGGGGAAAAGGGAAGGAAAAAGPAGVAAAAARRLPRARRKAAPRTPLRARLSHRHQETRDQVEAAESKIRTYGNWRKPMSAGLGQFGLIGTGLVLGGLIVVIIT